MLHPTGEGCYGVRSVLVFAGACALPQVQECERSGERRHAALSQCSDLQSRGLTGELINGLNTLHDCIGYELPSRTTPPFCSDFMLQEFYKVLVIHGNIKHVMNSH